jgi:hypothetical protein
MPENVSQCNMWHMLNFNVLCFGGRVVTLSSGLLASKQMLPNNNYLQCDEIKIMVRFATTTV